MIVKTNLAKIYLTETELILKSIFSKKKIKRNEIKSIYISNFNELNILTTDNKFIKKKYPSLKRKERGTLEQIVKSMESENIIVGTDFYKYSNFFTASWPFFIFILCNKSIVILIYLALLLLIITYGKLTECFYLYDTNSGNISIIKRKNLIGLLNIDDCKYKKSVYYNMYYEYRYKKHKLYFIKNITCRTTYNYYINPKKLCQDML